MSSKHEIDYDAEIARLTKERDEKKREKNAILTNGVLESVKKDKDLQVNLAVIIGNSLLNSDNIDYEKVGKAVISHSLSNENFKNSLVGIIGFATLNGKNENLDVDLIADNLINKYKSDKEFAVKLTESIEKGINSVREKNKILAVLGVKPVEKDKAKAKIDVTKTTNNATPAPANTPNNPQK